MYPVLWFISFYMAKRSHVVYGLMKPVVVSQKVTQKGQVCGVLVTFGGGFAVIQNMKQINENLNSTQTFLLLYKHTSFINV
jgi:hypothetical protein